jgi:HlyD family secretion protein
MSMKSQTREIAALSSAGDGRRSVRTAAGTVLAGALLVATACFGAEPQPANPIGAAVSVMKAKRACFKDSVEVTGVLVPREEVLVRPDREGLQIAKVFVEAGDTVKSGQVLARLSPPEGQPGGGSSVDVQAQVAGLVTRRSAIVGAMASARAEPLFMIVTQGELELAAEIPAKRFSSVSVGQAVTIRIIGVPEISGRIRFASASIDPTTQLGQIRISLGENSQLRMGTFARAIVEVLQRCGVGIPFSAVLYGTDGAIVQVVRDGRIETHRVALGLRADGTIEAREGINEGDMVVARAGSFVREGDRVRPILTDDTARK